MSSQTDCIRWDLRIHGLGLFIRPTNQKVNLLSSLQIPSQPFNKICIPTCKVYFHTSDSGCYRSWRSADRVHQHVIPRGRWRSRTLGSGWRAQLLHLALDIPPERHDSCKRLVQQICKKKIVRGVSGQSFLWGLILHKSFFIQSFDLFNGNILWFSFSERVILLILFD